jgi:PAS domain S-box-containing protein
MTRSATLRPRSHPKKLLARPAAVTDREQVAFLTSVLESSTEYSIVATDLSGTVLAWNEGARRNYGYEVADIVGRSALVLHDPDDVANGRAQSFLDEARRAGRWSGEIRRVRKDGTHFTGFLTTTLRHDATGAPTGFTMISRDVVESLRQSDGLRTSRNEEQLRRKNEELEEQYRRAQAANRLKSEFIANMSHELRTPLNAVIGFAELIHDGKVGPVNADQKEYLGDILTSSAHLLRLINDVLDLAKVESGKMEFLPETVDLGQLVGEVRDVVRPLAASKRIRIAVTVAPEMGPVVIDASKLKQVVYNYLSNALKFTGEDGHIAIRVAREGESFRLEVEDSGIGIKPADIGRLFGEFQQVDASTSKKYGGTGLGLALTKRIVEAQGGQVGVRSTPGKGSVFFAVLPVRAAAPSLPAPALPDDAQLGPRVLVVEDRPEDSAWLCATLGAAGYVTEAVVTGAAAIARCHARHYDAITLDLLLPDMSGRDVLKAARSGGPNRDTPVVIVTVIVEKGAAAGFHVQDILQKPVAQSDLLAALERARVPGGAGPVLVVDDDPKSLKLAERILRDAGYDVVCRSDGEAGLEAAERRPPVAVMLDLVMPQMDGMAFLERFRRTPHGRRTPVIVWTVKKLTRHDRDQVLASVQAIVEKGQGAGALLDELRQLAPLAALAAHA